MKKIIFIFAMAGLGLAFAKAVEAQKSSDIFKDKIMLSASDSEIQSLKDQIIKNGGTPMDFSPNTTYTNTHHPYASAEKKKKILRGYTVADEKSGLFTGINLGYGSLYNDYIDGSYNQNNTTIDTLKKQTTGVLKSPLLTQANLYMFGGKFGYQKFFNPYFGARIYGEGMLSGGPMAGDITDTENGNKIGTLIYMLGSMDFDLMVDIPITHSYKHYVGGYIGLGVGAMILLDNANKDQLKSLLKDTSYSSNNLLWNTLLQVDYTFNMGLSFTVNTKNRIEVGAKIPWTYLRLGLESPATYTNTSGDSKTLVSKDIEFKRSTIWTLSYTYLF
ncbi:outer membrane beta-barrel protein [Helicobacter cappadocius]|uniref:Outer membrane beta-barrel protein n=1 Tax=Helicobacter cappadocius TaxID=3063998 RepID=A0AA90T9V9_9HELI|nr:MULTISPECIES: outer membrane beta-barrel protein [unclassified Helicobacter]MDO7253298.1 outer membrane beta-barrel protein [Helicobacter sp. faydin-H75]MDP2539272.1 outer membrane beta-barrel protein [Helicobacter sp. faydin-H76]